MAHIYETDQGAIYDGRAMPDAAEVQDGEEPRPVSARVEEQTPAAPSDPAAPAFPLPDLSTKDKYAAFITEYVNDPWHPMRRDDARGLALAEHFMQAGMVLDGQPGGDRVLFEQVGDRLREPGTEAPGLELATLPELPAGQAWDRDIRAAAQQLVEDTPALSTAVERVYQAIVPAMQAATAGRALADWDAALEAQVGGPDAADTAVAHSNYILAALLADDRPRVVAAGQQLGTLAQWDPQVIVALSKAYDILKEIGGSAGDLVAGMLARAASVEHAVMETGRARARQAERDAQLPDNYELGHFGRP